MKSTRLKRIDLDQSDNGMHGATFLLIVNFSIGLSFAAAFVAFAGRSDVRLGYWCAGGFVAAATTVAIEAFAPYIPWERLTSFLSFTSFLLALTLIAAGLWRHYRPDGRLSGIGALFLLSILSHQAVIYDLPRDSILHAFAYQGSSVLMAAIAAAAPLASRRRRPIDRAVGCVLALCSVQFLFKAGLATAITTGQSVHTYIVSTYAHLSQTIGAVLSLLLGLSLLGLVIVEAMGKAAAAAQIDALSGALTRKGFLEEGRNLLKAATPSAPCCFVMADLDHFKSVNDRFGHAAGDEVIQHFGGLLTRLASGQGVCGRLGGEEFAVLLERCDEGKARLFLQALMSAMAQHEFRLLPAGSRVTASFGAVVCRGGGTLDEAMRVADNALYAAKRDGRDCCRFHEIETASATDPQALVASR